MHRYARVAGPTRHLVDDDLVELTYRGDRVSCRLRIWRGHSAPSVVLASRPPAGVPPSWVRSRLANLAYRAYLCFPEAGMLYFEAGDESATRLVQVAFESIGHGLRRQLVRPSERARCWRELEDIVGAEITA